MPAAKAKKAVARKAPARKAAPKKAKKPVSLPKSDGGSGIAAYIASMEPWQAAIAKRVDELVADLVPGVRKAVKWHSPMYGVEGQGWFLSFSGFQRHVKLNFFAGARLKPVPPSGEGHLMRSLDVREGDRLDERRLADWIKQASSIPGWGKS